MRYINECCLQTIELLAGEVNMAKNKKEAKLTEEKIEKAIKFLRQQIVNLFEEIDNIKRFAQEVISMFIQNVRYMKDELLLLAQRIAELETMAYEWISKRGSEVGE